MTLVKIGDVWFNPKYIITVQDIEQYCRTGKRPAVQIATATSEAEECVIAIPNMTADDVVEVIQKAYQRQTNA